MSNLPQHQHEHKQGPRWNAVILIGFMAVAGFFLLTEHRAHLFGILPFLLLLACPLMHLFHGHGGHGGHEGDEHPRASASASPIAGEDPQPHEQGGKKHER